MRKKTVPPQRRSERVAEVNALREEGLSLQQALPAVDLSKSSYFYRPQPRSARPLEPAVVTALEQMDGYELVYGYRKVTQLLRRRGLYRNPKCIYRHLRALGKLQPRKRKGRPHQVLRAWQPSASNQRWEADLAVVPCGVDGQAYGIAFLDCFDKEVLGEVFPGPGQVSQRCRAQEVEAAFWQALFRRYPNGVPVDLQTQIVLRVDRGGHFIARRIREVVRRAGLHLEVCRVQTPNDKPYIESFLSHYKTEEVYRKLVRGLLRGQGGVAELSPLVPPGTSARQPGLPHRGGSRQGGEVLGSAWNPARRERSELLAACPIVRGQSS